MKQPTLSDLYTCNLFKLYHKLYRYRLPPYFNNFLPEFGEHNHMLRNDLIRLPVVRCQFGEMNATHQTHLRREPTVTLVIHFQKNLLNVGK